jgi:hypothetical protein
LEALFWLHILPRYHPTSSEVGQPNFRVGKH